MARDAVYNEWRSLKEESNSNTGTSVSNNANLGALFAIVCFFRGEGHAATPRLRFEWPGAVDVVPIDTLVLK